MVRVLIRGPCIWKRQRQQRNEENNRRTFLFCFALVKIKIWRREVKSLRENSYDPVTIIVRPLAIVCPKLSRALDQSLHARVIFYFRLKKKTTVLRPLPCFLWCLFTENSSCHDCNNAVYGWHTGRRRRLNDFLWGGSKKTDLCKSRSHEDEFSSIYLSTSGRKWVSHLHMSRTITHAE